MKAGGATGWGSIRGETAAADLLFMSDGLPSNICLKVINNY